MVIESHSATDEICSRFNVQFDTANNKNNISQNIDYLSHGEQTFTVAFAAAAMFCLLAYTVVFPRSKVKFFSTPSFLAFLSFTLPHPFTIHNMM